MSLDVGSGKYAFLCSFADFNPQQGATVTVPGHAAGTPAIMPITYNELIPLAKKYVTEEEAAIKVMAPETATLAAAVRSGNLAAARRDWLTAHLQYETLGDAYGAFGNFDTEIDGRADAVGVNSPQWTGFYRLEYGLWHGQSLQSLAPVADTLNRYVDQLVVWWPTQEVTLSDLGRRAHEVIENALEFQLTGHDDYGSGTTLASTVAAITASRVLLALLQPLLATRYPGLPVGLFRAGPAAVAAGEGTAAERLVGPGVGALRLRPAGDRRRLRAGAAGTRPHRGHHRAEEQPQCLLNRRRRRKRRAAADAPAGARPPGPGARPGGRSCAAWPAGSRAA